MLKRIMALVLLTAFNCTAIAQSQDERIANLEKKVKELQDTKITGSSKGGFDISLYGFARLDALWSNSNITSTTGNAIFMWSNPDATGSDDSQLGITARNTRFGMDITGPSTDTLKSSAKIELDFSGRSDTENNNHPRIRHGYVQLDMPESKFSILAGQTWDVVAPVIPPTIDCSILWWQGNIGMRRSQLRLTQGVSINDETSLKFEGALARTMGSETNYNNIDSGTASGMPTVQARASITTPIFNGLKSTLGFSGHYGQEEFDTTIIDDGNTKYDSWSMAFDMTVPLSESTKVSGELYQGTNCGTYAGGIGQTINTDIGQEIDAMGGWVAIAHTINSKFSVAAGYGLDTADPEALQATNKQSNQTAYANVIYKPLPNILTGIELAHNKTEYMDNNDGESIRSTMFMQFNF